MSGPEALTQVEQVRLVDGFRMMAEYRMTPESTVQELTGRPGKMYRQWATENAAAFQRS
jgi:hypothetical protein